MDDALLWVAIGIPAALVLVILIVNFCRFCVEFTRELRYLNMEIARSEGTEQVHWRRKKRRLWLSVLPFVKY